MSVTLNIGPLHIKAGGAKGTILISGTGTGPAVAVTVTLTGFTPATYTGTINTSTGVLSITGSNPLTGTFAGQVTGNGTIYLNGSSVHWTARVSVSPGPPNGLPFRVQIGGSWVAKGVATIDSDGDVATFVLSSGESASYSLDANGNITGPAPWPYSNIQGTFVNNQKGTGTLVASLQPTATNMDWAAEATPDPDPADS